MTDSIGAPIASASIVLTSVPAADNFTANTDSAGHYEIRIPYERGEYVASVSAVGYASIWRRVALGASNAPVTVNVTLQRAVLGLTAVQVRARMPRPNRSDGREPFGPTPVGSDGTDKTFDGVQGALSPDQLGDLDAMVGLTPSLIATANGASLLGLDAGSNATTLNGLATSITTLPASMSKNVRIVSSPWDPSLGGAGARISSTLSEGSDIVRRRARATLAPAAFEMSDPIARATGDQSSYGGLSVGGSGPYQIDKLFYNYGIDFSRDVTPRTSLRTASAEALAHAGVSADSVQRLFSVLDALDYPVMSPAGNVATQTTATFAERIDHQPADSVNGVPAPAWWASGIATVSRSDGGVPVTALPELGTTRSSESAMLQAGHSMYFGPFGQYLNEASTSFSMSASRTDPLSSLPAGDILVTSPVDGGGVIADQLEVGGAGDLASHARSWRWQGVDHATILPAGPHLPMTLTVESNLSGYRRSTSADPSGTFTFASLSDFANNEPSGFSRTLTAPDASGGEWTGAGAVGVHWQRHDLFVTGGGRIDANAYLRTPAENTSVEQAFDVRTDEAPDRVGFSPRVGFNWYYSGAPGFSSFNSPISNLFRVAPQIHGGIGEFRDVPGVALLDNAMTSVSASGRRTLTCIGPAAPVPDWQLFATDAASIPTSCADGTPAFTDTARSVTLIDRSFEPTQSWRAALGWSGALRFLHLASVSLDGTYALNLNRPGTLDLNFAAQPQFRLAGDGRPVFVDAGSIVPATGEASLAASRRVAAFGAVIDEVSDLRSVSRQLTSIIVPTLPALLGVTLVGSYTYQDTRTQARGFDATTDGDPRTVFWEPAALPRHKAMVQFARLFSRVGVTGILLLYSGIPYTPIAGGDLNGDGRIDDRAFVLDPSRTSDTALANGMRRLLDSGSPTTRRCLTVQLGRTAAPNGCTGPWSASLNANVILLKAPFTRGRGTVSLYLANVLGGIDQAIHGTDALRGWGAPLSVDPVLYQVRAFNPATREYSYQVNAGFGARQPAASVARNPFRATLSVSFDLGRPVEEQQLELNLRLRFPLVGTRASPTTIAQRYMDRPMREGGFMDLYAGLIRLADSLALSRDQVDAFAAREHDLRQRADTIYGVLGRYLAQLPPRYDADTALRHVNDTAAAMWRVIYEERTFLAQILTPGQRRLLPRPVQRMIDDPTYAGRFDL